MRVVLTVILLLTINNSVISDEYKPLNIKERHEFNQVYKSIIEAYYSHDYAIIKKYCDGVVDKYESIMLDSKCKDLRPKLEQLKKIIIDSKREFEYDSLSQLIEISYMSKDYEKCATAYQSLFEFCDKEGVFDSIKKIETQRLYECIEKMYSEAPTYETFKKIDQMRYSDSSFVKKIRKEIESRFEDRLLSLSSSLNADSLILFRKNYPGIYTNDVNSLIEKARDKYRLSVLRNISPAAAKVFYDKFGGPDDEIESKLENSMFMNFSKEKTKEAAENYLYRFPKGKYAEIVNGFLLRTKGNAATDSMLQSTNY